jgi:hypothetical protein
MGGTLFKAERVQTANVFDTAHEAPEDERATYDAEKREDEEECFHWSSPLNIKESQDASPGLSFGSLARRRLLCR